MHDHIVPKKIYVSVFAALMVLTLLTVAAARVDLGRLNTVVALTIAVTKALLVVLFFMDMGTRSVGRRCLGGPLAHQDLEQGGAYHATKALLAGLRCRSTRSAGYRNGYDCTAHIDHLTSQNPARRCVSRFSCG